MISPVSCSLLNRDFRRQIEEKVRRQHDRAVANGGKRILVRTVEGGPYVAGPYCTGDAEVLCAFTQDRQSCLSVNLCRLASSHREGELNLLVQSEDFRSSQVLRGSFQTCGLTKLLLCRTRGGSPADESSFASWVRTPRGTRTP